ncbi:MAG: hypothetical protein JO083_10130 [Candidatus Eremiobacteraeota bacterium]|nr:hypothetical protein [Candidatus Eremiobacteraeota bacterium]
MGLLRSAALGKIAGCAGTLALDVTTYLDMLVRGRPASDVPAELVKKFAEAAGIAALISDDDAACNRRSAAGALLGYATGLTVGAAFGIVRPALRGVPPVLAGLVVGAAAMALADVPLARAGVTDPKTWGTAGWLADIVPHVVYGLTVVAVFDAIGANGERE